MHLCARRRAGLASSLGLTAALVGCDPVEDPSSLYHAADVEDGGDAEMDYEPTLQVDDRYDIPEGTQLAWVDFGGGPLKVAYEVHNGEAVFQGDIILGDADEVAAASAAYEQGDHDDQGFRSAVAHLQGWPDGVIPFEIDPAMSSTLTARVNTAIRSWNKTTLVSLVARNPKDPFERFVRFTSEGAKAGLCSSFLGKVWGFGPQDIKLDTGCSVGNIRHEIGHAVGLLHEQSRMDRDDTVLVNFANIVPGMESQFFTYDVMGVFGLDFGPYDLSSVMQYGSFANSAMAVDPTVPVLVRAGCAPTSTSAACTFVSTSALSQLDIAGVTRQVTGDPPAFRLRSQSTNRCLRPVGGSLTSGARVTQTSCSNSPSRRWYTWKPPTSSRVRIINQHSRMCLSWDNNDQMIQVSCGTKIAGFSFVSSGLFNGEKIRTATNRCVRASTTSGAFLSTTCSDTNDRRWYRDWL